MKMTVVEAFAKVEAEGKTKAVKEVRVINKIEIGQIVRQGDIYIQSVPMDHPRAAKSKTRQLALGTTKGSRHIAETGEVYEGKALPKWCQQGTFLGPVVVSETARVVISHPEHAHVDLPPGCYQISHQSDARTLDRVRD